MENDVRRVLATTPAIVRALVEGAPGAVDFHEHAGAWSPRQILCHLADGEITDWMPRIDVLLSPDPSRRFTPFDRQGGFRRYDGWSVSRLLDEFDRLREANLARLEGLDLKDEDLGRTAQHPDLGTVTLAQLLNCWATHDLAHIAQVSRVLVRHRGPGVGPWRKYFSLLADQAG